MVMAKSPKNEKEPSNKVKTIIVYIVSAIIVVAVIYGAIIGIQSYQKQKEIEEYDNSVYETVMNFHNALESVDQKIRNRNLKRCYHILTFPILMTP